MKLIKPRDPQPKNVVQFEVSMQMSKFDIKNYLEKIYNVPVENVVTHVRMGKGFCMTRTIVSISVGRFAFEDLCIYLLIK